MGVLDDAIREHLDLKRARGGDPTEIERMEREALGPVRREPTIGSTRFDAAENQTVTAPEAGYPDDRNELLDLGYRDSTAPHPHHEHQHHEHADPHFEHHYDDPSAAPPEEAEQPKRRFLRRNRQASQSGSTLPDQGIHEEPEIDPYGMLEQDRPREHHQPVEYHEPVEHHDPLEPLEPHEPLEHHHEPLEPNDLSEHEVADEAGPGATPPHLRFDHPPKRPRFSAEPPSPDAEADGEAAPEQSAPAVPPPTPTEPRPAHAAEPEDRIEAQETTEFDVEKHIAEGRFQGDPETRAQPGSEAPAEHDASKQDEDVLEETPEFLQDTPEHDRLWFEQRPPRDFDFDG